MWKIFAGIVVVILIGLFIFMNTGDRVENRIAASATAAFEAAASQSTKPTVTPTPSVWTHRTAPTAEAAAAAANDASIDLGRPLPTKMSTTGTTFVPPKNHTPQ